MMSIPSSRPSLTSVTFWNTFFGFVLVGAACSIFRQESPGGCGDYPQNFQVLYEGMVVGATAAIIFYFAYPRIPYGFMAQPLMLTGIRYLLAYFILGYGVAKVFASQFPHTMANMDARFVELTPMRVAWAFFGYSKGYQVFLGWGEVIPAILLLFRRTTLIGAILMFTVMLNVFLVNVFFDVCVKLNSGLYTSLALYIMLQETRRLWNFFFTNRITGPRVTVNLENPRWLKLTVITLNVAAVGYVFYSGATQLNTFYQYSKTQIALTPVQGPWKTILLKQWNNGQWLDKNRFDSLYADRVFFDGFNGVIKSDHIRDRFRFSVDSAANQLEVSFTNLRNEWNIEPVKWKFERPFPDTLNLFVRWKTDSLMMKCVRRRETLTRY